MGEAKKIGPHLLEDEVAEKIFKKVDFDDLDSELRTYINNKGSAPVGYDDTNLRDRIVNIENKMAASTVEADLAALTTKVNKNTNDISTLDAKKIDTVDAENLKKNIVFSDLDANTRKKITDAYSYYQGIMPSGSLSTTTPDLTSIASTINTIKNNMVSKSDLSAYTKNSDIIPNSRLETSTINAINKVISGGSIGGSGGGSGAYRSIDVPIDYKDLSNTVKDMLKGIDPAEGPDEEQGENFRNSIVQSTIGTFCGQVPLHKRTNTKSEGGKFSSTGSGKTARGATFDLYQQRQIIKNSGGVTYDVGLPAYKNEDNPGPKIEDSYKLVDVLAWLYYDIIGDFELLTPEFQEAVSSFSEDKNQKLDNPGYFGVAYQVFPLMDAIIYLADRIIKLEETINSINSTYYSSSERTPEAKNTSIPDRLKRNNTKSSYDTKALGSNGQY